MLKASAKTSYGYAICIGLNNDDLELLKNNLALVILFRDIDVTQNGLFDNRLSIELSSKKPRFNEDEKLFFFPVNNREVEELDRYSDFIVRINFGYRKKLILKILLIKADSEERMIRMFNNSDMIEEDATLEWSGFGVDAKAVADTDEKDFQ